VHLLVVDPDGRVHGHGDPDARRLALARLSAQGAAPAGWAALVPEGTGQEAGPAARPGAGPFGDVRVDTTTRLTERVPAGEAAALGDLQRQVAEEEGLRVEPTQAGPESIYSAILVAVGGGIWLARDMYVDSPTELRHALAGLVRERPDVLDAATWQRLRRITGDDDLDTEKIVDVLTDPAGWPTDQLARHLAAPYLGVELRVIEPGDDQAPGAQGTGRPITIAPTPGRHGEGHWAALVPARPGTPPLTEFVDLPGLPPLPSPPVLPGLPESLAFDRPLAAAQWDPDHYRLLKPGAVEPDDPWRNSSFCVEDENGAINCVSVAVIILDHPRAATLTAL
jgi:hypothetical protein